MSRSSQCVICINVESWSSSCTSVGSTPLSGVEHHAGHLTHPRPNEIELGSKVSDSTSIIVIPTLAKRRGPRAHGKLPHHGGPAVICR